MYLFYRNTNSLVSGYILHWMRWQLVRSTEWQVNLTICVEKLRFRLNYRFKIMVHFLMNIFSEPTTGQSDSKSDTESDIEFDIAALVNASSSDSDHVVSKHRMDVRKSDRTPPVEWMRDPTSSDQALINAKVLSQLDAIGKLLNAIESTSVHKPHSKAIKAVCKPVAVSSNLTASQGEAHLQESLPNLQTICHDRLFKSKLRIVSRNCLALVGA